MTNRAWSRAGAIASVVSAGVSRRTLVMSTRIALLVGGSLLIAAAVALMLWNDFGPGPLDVFIVGLRETTGIPLAVAVWLAFALTAVLAWALGRRPGAGTVTAPVIIGLGMQWLLEVFERWHPPTGFASQVGVHLVAVGLAGFGAGALIVAGLGAGTGELLAMAASDRLGRTVAPVRLGIEFGWLVVGVILGGPVGVGTVLVALAIGPSVVFGHRAVDRAAASSRHRIARARRTDAPSVADEAPVLETVSAS